MAWPPNSMPTVDQHLYDRGLFGDLYRRDPTSGAVDVWLGALAKKFRWEPFTVLDARQGKWQERKQAWLELGIQSEVGRQSDPTGKGDVNRGTMTCISNGTSPDIAARFAAAGNTTSVFDPVLCELMYEWFCPPGGQVVDGFAGGSVRGIVAAYTGRTYWGCELRPEQIHANRAQANQLCYAQVQHPTWVCGDARVRLVQAPEADFILTCPPYGNLELYSTLPGDLSNMAWPDFCQAYQQIIKQMAQRLRPNRFACIVVGDYRDKETGYYRNFPAMTQIFFRQAGLQLYNEGILLTAVGSLPVRMGHFN